MKSAYIQTKDKAEHSVEAEEYSANEYATDRMESGAKRGAEETARQTKKQLGNAKDGAKMVKNNILFTFSDFSFFHFIVVQQKGNFHLRIYNSIDNKCKVWIILRKLV